MQKRKLTVNKPPFLQDGKITPGDLVVRNAAGYPVGTDGQVDIEAMKRESLSYYTKLHTAQGSKRASNFTPPKRKRK